MAAKVCLIIQLLLLVRASSFGSYAAPVVTILCGDSITDENNGYDPNIYEFTLDGSYSVHIEICAILFDSDIAISNASSNEQISSSQLSLSSCSLGSGFNDQNITILFLDAGTYSIDITPSISGSGGEFILNFQCNRLPDTLVDGVMSISDKLCVSGAIEAGIDGTYEYLYFDASTNRAVFYNMDESVYLYPLSDEYGTNILVEVEYNANVYKQ